MATKGKTITDVADDVAASAGGGARSASDKASHIISEARDEVSALADKAGSGVRSAAAGGKDMAADALHDLAGAARQFAEKMGDSNGDGSGAKAADYARKAADTMDRYSSRLKDKDVDDIAEDARTLVKDHPAIVVGAAALIGFALARFMRGGGGRNA